MAGTAPFPFLSSSAAEKCHFYRTDPFIAFSLISGKKKGVAKIGVVSGRPVWHPNFA